jgi:hypothetical protein
MLGAMTSEICPSCAGKFDSQKCRYTGGWFSYFKPRWPSDQIDHQFTVRCPHCGVTYVSDNVKFLGIATRKTYLLFALILVILVVVLNIYAG